jgi:hypothetical protein
LSAGQSNAPGDPLDVNRDRLTFAPDDGDVNRLLVAQRQCGISPEAV